eukprot:2235129-Rhodomonas_salina.5
MCDLKPLEGIAHFYLAPYSIQNRIHQLCTFRISTPRPIVCRPTRRRNKVFRTKERTVCSGTNRQQAAFVQIREYRPCQVPTGCCLVEKGTDALQLIIGLTLVFAQSVKTCRMHVVMQHDLKPVAVYSDRKRHQLKHTTSLTVLFGDDLPEPCTDLIPTLPNLYRHNLAHATGTSFEGVQGIQLTIAANATPFGWEWGGGELKKTSFPPCRIELGATTAANEDTPRSWSIFSAQELPLRLMRLCEQTRNAISQTPLFTASQAGKLEAAEILLANKADPNATGDHGIRPIHRAAMAGHDEVVRMLLRHGADPLVVDEFMMEGAIHLASREGHAEVLISENVLLSSGHQNNNGCRSTTNRRRNWSGGKISARPRSLGNDGGGSKGLDLLPIDRSLSTKKAISDLDSLRNSTGQGKDALMTATAEEKRRCESQTQAFQTLARPGALRRKH